jgi:hypothetical protein
MRAPATKIAVVATVLVASGCASSGAKKSTSSVVSPVAVKPAGSTTAARPVVLPISPKGMRGLEPPQAARFLSSTRLAIAGVAGSSNCPSVPKKLIVESPHRIRIDLAVGSWGRTAAGRRVQVPERPRICLADLHPVPVVIAIDPARIDVRHHLKVSLHYPKFAVRRSNRPVVVIVPPLPTARTREEVRIARASNPRLFSIFPTVPGRGRCVIPHNSPPPQDYRGICRTFVRVRRTMEPSWSVTFTESWGPSCPPGTDCPGSQLTRHHTWQVIEGETIVKPGTKPRVYFTRSRGATAPQHSN